MTGIVLSPPRNNSVFEASGYLEVAKFSPSEIIPVEIVPWQTPPPPLVWAHKWNQ